MNLNYVYANVYLGTDIDGFSAAMKIYYMIREI